MPKMTHPDATHQIDVDPDQVSMYAEQGWQVKAPAKKADAKPADDK